MNHGPENTPPTDRDPGQEPQAAAEGVTGADGAAASGGVSRLFGPGSGSAPGDALDEAALRRMMLGAVQGLEPSDGTLDHLYRAVPARRARRRQALVGAAAAALLLGTAVPAFVHVANSETSSTASPAIAGHGEQAQGGSGEEPGAKSGSGGGTGGSDDGQQSGTEGTPQSTVSPSDSSGQGTDEKTDGGSADDPAASAQAVMPACTPDQLGVASAATHAAGADGTVYGTFRIANVSGKNCSVSSSGTVGFAATGAADPARIVVVRHTQGDPASGLPDPAQEEATVLLKPEMSYEVQFAWVPEETCPTTGSSPSPTPTDGAVGSTGGAAGSTTGTGTGDGEAGTETQFGSDEGDGAAKGAVSVMHTPEPGAPVAETTIPNACAGTIYRTGVLEPTS
ncbi:hypothetical protein E6R60_12460 [Streptomyces sp. A0642]|uniref:hypothetical protein n=1 Tax=Streptomyces sp. A0642 TaxID=2563100 RepID=UPI0010A26A07|nr:hypothetical protein [Streptomyces sp. A0642]THA76422.1 hypothetical protein E6R60_12460 [Streptomyces sp. A0642]